MFNFQNYYRVADPGGVDLYPDPIVEKNNPDPDPITYIYFMSINIER